MSFDLFVNRFQDGEAAPFQSLVLVRAIAPFVVETTPKWFELRFADEDGCTIFAETNSDEIDGFNVNRPCSNAKLYEALFAVLKTPGMVLIVPSDCPPLIGLAETASHLPQDMVDALGSPVLLRSASEILRRIRDA